MDRIGPYEFSPTDNGGVNHEHVVRLPPSPAHIVGNVYERRPEERDTPLAASKSPPGHNGTPAFFPLLNPGTMPYIESARTADRAVHHWFRWFLAVIRVFLGLLWEQGGGFESERPE